jgi:hypothetical protein
MLREICADNLECVAFELGCKLRSPGCSADFRLQILSSFFTCLNRFERAMRLRSISGSYFGFRMINGLQVLLPRLNHDVTFHELSVCKRLLRGRSDMERRRLNLGEFALTACQPRSQ